MMMVMSYDYGKTMAYLHTHTKMSMAADLLSYSLLETSGAMTVRSNVAGSKFAARTSAACAAHPDHSHTLHVPEHQCYR